MYCGLSKNSDHATSVHWPNVFGKTRRIAELFFNGFFFTRCITIHFYLVFFVDTHTHTLEIRGVNFDGSIGRSKVRVRRVTQINTNLKMESATRFSSTE